MPFESNEVESRSRSSATRPSNAFKWCSPRCNVWRHHGCCYNPVCNRKRRRACRWINFLTGGWIENLASIFLRGELVQGRLVLFLAVCPMEVGPDSRDVKSRNNYFFRPQNNKNMLLLLISAQTMFEIASSDTNEFSCWRYLWCWWQSFSVTSSNQKDFAKSANFYISACEMQEIPIIGTSFLEEDAQSYPGTIFQNNLLMSPKIQSF